MIDLLDIDILIDIIDLLIDIEVMDSGDITPSGDDLCGGNYATIIGEGINKDGGSLKLIGKKIKTRLLDGAGTRKTNC